MKRLLLLGMALFLLGTASAQARPFGPVEEADYAYAQAFWGVQSPPLCGEVVKTVEPPATGTTADATMPTSLTSRCVMQVSEEPVESNGPGIVCIAIIHEFGHLLGLGHSADPGSVMYPEPATSLVPYCQEQEEAAEAAWNERFWTHFRKHCNSIAAIRPQTERLRKRVYYCRRQINPRWS
jgi:hypothetical protein